MQKRTTLIAEEGMMLTDGKDFASVTYLALGADESKWYEIPKAEYDRIMAEKETSLTENPL